MTEIVRAIYDMMGKYTYPALKGDVPQQHVDAFFRVSYKVHIRESNINTLTVIGFQAIMLKPAGLIMSLITLE